MPDLIRGVGDGEGHLVRYPMAPHYQAQPQTEPSPRGPHAVRRLLTQLATELSIEGSLRAKGQKEQSKK